MDYPELKTFIEEKDVNEIAMLCYSTVLQLMNGNSVINDLSAALTFFEKTAASQKTPEAVQLFIIMQALTIVMANQLAEFRVKHLGDDATLMKKFMFGMNIMGGIQLDSIIQVIRAKPDIRNPQSENPDADAVKRKAMN